MSAEPSDDHPLARLRAQIRELHLHDGEPSTRTIAGRTGKAISHTTVAKVLRAPTLPAWGQVELVVEALGGDIEAFRLLWIAARKAGPPAADTVPVFEAPVDSADDDQLISPADRGRAARFLLVAGGWDAGLGSISTLNRDLAVALAADGADVRVAVPAATREELNSATSAGVRLVTPEPIPGINGRHLMLAKPRFTDRDYQPDVIVGHGRQVGSYAYGLQRLYFPRARRIHVVHTDPDRLDSAEENEHLTRMLGDARREVEIDLAATATLVAAVGPQLTELIRDRLRRRPGTMPEVVNLEPGLHDWGQMVDPHHPPGLPRILLMASPGDGMSKEIDMFVRAARTAAAHPRFRDQRLQLVIRGIAAEDVRDRIGMVAGQVLEVTFRPYTSAEGELSTDLRQAQVVAMPSHHEGFGLTTYQAIAAGVPVLVSVESGLAQMIASMFTDEARPPEILPTRGVDADVEKIWTTALTNTLADPHRAFQRAAQFREQIGARASWDAAIAELLARLGL
ncbi:glycosyltransferase family 4 protein [Paractinoplanes atraurantiacus]|uniref:Glycosyltransferase involved in cell wall bisynthesis n=1 Tax=Paractinoplanes atraurantiacus TaxID=1036182 RepID=A0A285KN67_9ACTN|nr:glycosyltransferase family 4 protein [Actinoplanes atraurantiacus]SNY74092.1 Glycosyltransferase involved in cell wall bisynthesis [Actinoplanes atraurantiacus]